MSTKVEIIERIKEAEGLKSDASLADFLGISKPALANWRARNSIDYDVVFSKCEHLDFNWLVTGKKTEPLPEAVKSDDGEKQESHRPAHFLPLIPIDAVAGFNGIDEPGISFAECPVYAVPEFIAAKAEYMIRVSGSSMYPKYSNGDILACRRIPEITFIQWGKVYVIDSMQGAMVKRLFEIDDNPDELLCKSDNENYPPFRIPRSEIRSLSIVLGVVRLE